MTCFRSMLVSTRLCRPWTYRHIIGLFSISLSNHRWNQYLFRVSRLSLSTICKILNRTWPISKTWCLFYQDEQYPQLNKLVKYYYQTYSKKTDYTECTIDKTHWAWKQLEPLIHKEHLPCLEMSAKSYPWMLTPVFPILNWPAPSFSIFNMYLVCMLQLLCKSIRSVLVYHAPIQNLIII